MAQGSDEGLGVPVAEGRMVDKARAFWRPSGGLGHVRLQRRLVDETEARQRAAHERLASCDPDMACLPDLRPLLLEGLQVFFCVSAQDRAKTAKPRHGEWRCRDDLQVRRPGRSGSDRASPSCAR